MAGTLPPQRAAAGCRRPAAATAWLRSELPRVRPCSAAGVRIPALTSPPRGPAGRPAPGRRARAGAPPAMATAPSGRKTEEAPLSPSIPMTDGPSGQGFVLFLLLI